MRLLSFVLFLVFTASVSAQSPMVSKLFNDGTKAAARGDFVDALKSYEKALTIAENEKARKENLAKLHFNIGACLYRLDRADDAVIQLSKAVDLKGGYYPKALYVLGMAQIQQKNWPRARIAFEQALKLNERDAESWFDLAFVHLAQADFANAETAFRKAVEFGSVDAAWGHNNLGVILAMKNDFKSAEKEFETALFLSDGKLIEAENNLKYCRDRHQKLPLVAKLEFVYRKTELGD